MSREPTTLADFMAEYEAELIEKAKRDQARYDSPDEIAKREARRKADFDKGVRLGWWDENGDPLPQPDEDDEEEDAE